MNGAAGPRPDKHSAMPGSGGSAFSPVLPGKVKVRTIFAKEIMQQMLRNRAILSRHDADENALIIAGTSNWKPWVRGAIHGPR
jgi:hypothetical protein